MPYQDPPRGRLALRGGGGGCRLDMAAVAHFKGRTMSLFSTDRGPSLDSNSHSVSCKFGVRYRSVGRLKRKFRLSPSKRRIIVNGQTNYCREKKTSEIGLRGKRHQKI